MVFILSIFSQRLTRTGGIVYFYKEWAHFAEFTSLQSNVEEVGLRNIADWDLRIDGETSWEFLLNIAEDKKGEPGRMDDKIVTDLLG